MTNFLLGLIVGSTSSKNNKSNGYRSKSVTPPKPPLPPPPKSLSNNILIELKFCEGFDWNNIEIVELNSYKEFFIFYQENHDKGLIYDIELKKWR